MNRNHPVMVLLQEEEEILKIRVKNFNLTPLMFENIIICMAYASISQISLWNCAIGDQHMNRLLNNMAGITHLYLDNNNVGKSMSVISTILQQDDICLKYLSLRYNSIGDVGAGYLGNALKFNRTLIVLSLAGNRIGPNGAFALANGLIYNQSLLSLSLASNAIEDSGAHRLSSVFVREKISADEAAIRKKFHVDLVKKEELKNQRNKKNEVWKQTNKAKSGAKKRETQNSKQLKDSSRKSSILDTNKPVKADTGGKSDTSKASGTSGKAATTTGTAQQASNIPAKKGGMVRVKTADEQEETTGEPILPFVLSTNDEWFSYGNRYLTNLNLMRNGLTQSSVNDFLEVFKIQAQINSQANDGLLGLQRVTIRENNGCLSDLTELNLRQITPEDK
jgi:hypothetical protein